jgi:UDP-N-acetylglucosamine 1-carboxyvinyltransferase
VDKFVIEGGMPLTGDIYVSGAKNSALALIPATLLLDSPCIIENVPDISDVSVCLKILRGLGADVERLTEDTYRISCEQVNSFCIPDEDARKMRASYYFLGALLGRCGKAEVAMPGGCSIGERPIDQHLKAFEALGTCCTMIRRETRRDGTVRVTSLTPEILSMEMPEGAADVISLRANELTGNAISFDVISVGATMNAILAAVKARGVTIIENAAREPHVVDLANFLNYMGASIKGAGTDVIKIVGVEHLNGNVMEGSCEERRYAVVPDQIEAGTFMVAAAATRGAVTIHGVIPKHLEVITSKLRECGVHVEENDDSVVVSVDADTELKATNIRTDPHPGYPTDMQPQMAALLTMAQGHSKITETVWENRFRYVDELKKMGARIDMMKEGAMIYGGAKLRGAQVQSCDLRAGAAMVIAGLAAEGVTEITDIRYIERGYSNLVQKLQGIGGRMQRVHTEE